MDCQPSLPSGRRRRWPARLRRPRQGGGPARSGQDVRRTRADRPRRPRCRTATVDASDPRRRPGLTIRSMSQTSPSSPRAAEPASRPARANRRPRHEGAADPADPGRSRWRRPASAETPRRGAHLVPATIGERAAHHRASGSRIRARAPAVPRPRSAQHALEQPRSTLAARSGSMTLTLGGVPLGDRVDAQ